MNGGGRGDGARKSCIMATKMAEQVSKQQKGHDKDAQLAEVSWERWGLVIRTWLPYGTLALALGLSWLQPGQSWSRHAETALLAVLAGLWVTLAYLRPAQKWRGLRWRVPVYFAGFLAFSAALMARQPIFFLFAVTGFFHASDLKPWPLVFVGIGLTSTLINTLITGFPWPDRASWIFFGALIVFQTVIIGFGTRLAEKLAHLSEQRRQAVANLEAALAEIKGLQAQLLRQAREAGVLEERQRLAREIHDTLAQGLVGIITQLSAAEQAAGQARENAESQQRHLDHALRLARENLAEARRSVHALRPGPLENAGLPEALAEAAQQWSMTHGVKVDVHTTGSRQALMPDVEAALLRVAQEALSNIARHAGASRAGITLSYMRDMVVLDVRDDGVGFDVAAYTANGGSGFGLASMHQRVKQVAGSLDIESETGGGTAVSARIRLYTPSQETENR